MSSRPLVLGHRGAPFAARENTVAAFRAALDEGADGVELDVQRSADGALVLFHDTAVDGVPVHHLTLAELRARVGEVDTLMDAFAALPHDAAVFVEVKRQHSAVEHGLLDEIASLARGRSTGRTVVGSFDPWLAELLAVRAPGLHRGWIADRASLGPSPRITGEVDVLSLELAVVTGPLFDAFANAAPTTLAWPVDADAELDRCFDLFPRLTGVITKHPGRARARWDRR